MFFKKPPPKRPAPAPLPPKKASFPYILLTATFFCVWLVWASLSPKLPKAGEPPRLYSNQAQFDLKRALLHAIKRADHSIFMVMFGLSDPSILGAVSKKIKEEIPTTIYYDPIGTPDVRKILEGSKVHPIRNSGLMHQKILILDEETLFIGSANFTTASLQMHDNLVIGVTNPKLARFIREKAPHSFGNLRTMVGGQDMELWLLPDPRGHILTELKRKLRSATRSIQVALFTFTHTNLADELIRAHKRGVDVTVVLDFYSGLGASAKIKEQLQLAGIKVRVSQGGKLLHHKFALIDGQTLIAGSANWTKAAFTKNADCILFLYNLTLEQKKFMGKLWNQIAKESKKVENLKVEAFSY